MQFDLFLMGPMPSCAPGGLCELNFDSVALLSMPYFSCVIWEFDRLRGLRATDSAAESEAEGAPISYFP